jgi:predicted enzyme related to lactoylglutathione lyase
VRAKGIMWLGIKTNKHAEMVEFFRDAMGLEADLKEPDFAVLKCPNGDTVELFGPRERDHGFFTTGPVAGFLVEDVDDARRELEGHDVEFLGPVHRWGEFAWTHFRSPDGTILELTSGPYSDASGSDPE